MPLGRRLFDLARTELNALLDKASRLGEDDAASGGDGLEAFSMEELEAELERRKLEREIEDRARQARARPSTGPSRSGYARPGAGPAPRGSRPPPKAAPPVDKVAKAYAALELKPGADFAEVKAQYRKLMRKYHPDKHVGSPEKEKAAHELTQKLTDAYRTLEQRLRKP